LSREDKDRMLQEMRHGLAEVERLAADIRTPETKDHGWNARDILAHMAFWEQRAHQILNLASQNRDQEVPHPRDETENDEWNARVQRENQSTPWPMALRYWTDLRRKTIQQFEKAPLDLLTRNYRERDYSVMEQLAGDTSAHDQEHLP
jgi:hypothetical protein